MTTDYHKLRILIEYDGTDFSGWQVQENAPRTVQGVMEAALGQILQQKVTLIGSGRTDAGVHAEGQVAHAVVATPKMPLERLLLALNSLLPKEVQVLGLDEAPEGFHARYSATARSYRYRLERRHHPLRRRIVWVPPYPWEDKLIQEAVALVAGRHSFKSFSLERPGESEYICVVESASWTPDEGGATFRITADRFFHKMVRGLVGALFDLGRGCLSPEDFRQLLDQPERNGAVYIAPPQGLVLEEVRYDTTDSTD